MGNAGRSLAGGAALAGADYYMTGGKLAEGVYNGAANVVNSTASGVNSLIQGQAAPMNVLSPTAAANMNAAPLLGSATGLAALATGGYSLYRGYNKSKEHGLARGTQEAALSFGTITGLTAALGLTATTSLTAPALAVGAGIWGTRQLYHGGKAFIEAPVASTWYGVTTPFRWSGQALGGIKNGWGKVANSNKAPTAAAA